MAFHGAKLNHEKNVAFNITRFTQNKSRNSSGLFKAQKSCIIKCTEPYYIQPLQHLYDTSLCTAVIHTLASTSSLQSLCSCRIVRVEQRAGFFAHV